MSPRPPSTAQFAQHILALFFALALFACPADSSDPHVAADAGVDVAMDTTAVLPADPPCPRTSNADYARTLNSITRDPTWWPRSAVEPDGLALFIDPKGTSDLSNDTSEAAINRAIDTWNQAGAGCATPLPPLIRVLDDDTLAIDDVLGYNRDGPNTNALVFIDDADAWDARRGSLIIAATISSVRPRTSEILDVDIELNDARYTFTDTLPLPPDSLDLTSVVIHELGHLLGLDHIQTEASVMFPTEEEGVDVKRDLTEGDRAGACESFACY